MDDEWLERRALHYLGRWEATREGLARVLERGVRRRCLRTGEDPEAPLALIPALVDRLSQRGYVDDRRFATQLFESLRRQGRSRLHIHGKLRHKGVPDPIVRELVERDEPESELQAAWRLARKRRLGPHCPDPDRRAASRSRHLAALARQGFSREIAYRVIDADEIPELP
ncbi:MAG: regulatory protein RecX [Deltaproteobacteria bacterium]|jgi:regulatory protein|nr:regulatory protein RecX [Deltaproteobacteria bacterium]MBW2500347.1 regulatory protein RecX [Deltaproteobacteria bacterium]